MSEAKQLGTFIFLALAGAVLLSLGQAWWLRWLGYLFTGGALVGFTLFALAPLMILWKRRRGR